MRGAAVTALPAFASGIDEGRGVEEAAHHVAGEPRRSVAPALVHQAADVADRAGRPHRAALGRLEEGDVRLDPRPGLAVRAAERRADLLDTSRIVRE
jgi:hypothetical protein